MTTLSGPMLAPLSGGEPKQLVVLLHGYGSDGSDLIALGRHWQDLLPDALFVSPNAPDVCSENPQGFQWFALDLNRSASRLTGLPLARPIVVEFLKALWAQTGLSAKDTILAGFSQGAMMALHVGTSLEENLLGIIAFSGAFVEPEGVMDGNKARPSICLVHGDLDNVVDPAYSAEAAKQLSQLGFQVNYHVSQGVGHGISPDGLAFAGAFIAGLPKNL
jgi:phospholipase/carboxylesterase